MRTRRLTIDDALEFTPPSFPDHRGKFVAPFQHEPFAAATGHPLTIAQVNNSVSTTGVIRGVHFADVPPGQAKYVYCARGEVLDVVVDVRTGSPTFGRWDAVRLDAEEHRAVYLPEGLGHAFLALAPDTAVVYLCSTGYDPSAEHGIDPLDPELGLPWADWLRGEPVLSAKDRAAPGLRAAAERGLLPDYESCRARYAQLRQG
ncbi:dTDP-4-dehydrorhamnose 3,5-epimerase family protein [Salinifilum aidingensis]